MSLYNLYENLRSALKFETFAKVIIGKSFSCKKSHDKPICIEIYS